MRHLSKVSFWLLQTLFVVGVLAGCATQPQAESGMMQGDMMQNCQAMMKQNNITQQCQQMMKTCQDMMGSLPKDKMMQCQQMISQGGMMQGNGTNNTVQPPLPQTDDSSHAQHHPQQ